MAETDPSPFFDVRMRGFRDRSEVEDVLGILQARTARLEGENVTPGAAAGRVLAEPVMSMVDVPGFARAAMDGFAVRAEDTFGADAYNPLPLTLIGEALPARPYASEVGPGQAVRVMTGAPMPVGADAVLMAEVAQVESADRVLAREAVSPGRHVGRVGEDVAKGREVLPSDRRLRPQDLGLLASIGAGTVNVVRRPRVAILVTGDELLPPGSIPEGYRIVDSNSPMIEALVARDGGTALSVQYLPDRYEAVREAIHDARADIVLISGGSSVGKEDHAPRAVAELGELAVHGVALRPASPTGVGFIPPRTVFLLPGNPVSCLCAYDLFAGRVVRKLGGQQWDLPYRRTQLPLASKIVSAVGRVDYVRVGVAGDLVHPIAVSGASILSTTVKADGFVLVDRDREGFAPGESVEVWLYD
jgi:molybdopterin molybdotransferase